MQHELRTRSCPSSSSRYPTSPRFPTASSWSRTGSACTLRAKYKTDAEKPCGQHGLSSWAFALTLEAIRLESQTANPLVGVWRVVEIVFKDPPCGLPRSRSSRGSSCTSTRMHPRSCFSMNTKISSNCCERVACCRRNRRFRLKGLLLRSATETNRLRNTATPQSPRLWCPITTIPGLIASRRPDGTRDLTWNPVP